MLQILRSFGFERAVAKTLPPHGQATAQGMTWKPCYGWGQMGPLSPRCHGNCEALVNTRQTVLPASWQFLEKCARAKGIQQPAGMDFQDLG